MTEFRAAIGREQLKKPGRMVESRRRNAAYLRKHLQEIEGVTPPNEASCAKHAFYYLALRIESKTLRVTRE